MKGVVLLVLLTSTMLVRVDDQDEAAEMAAAMTEATEKSLHVRLQDVGLSIEESRQLAYPLGVLVQVVPDDVAN
jgi:hypothetical protein